MKEKLEFLRPIIDKINFVFIVMIQKIITTVDIRDFH